jgi:hypothetical protein
LWKVKPYKYEYDCHSDNTKQYGITFFERGVHFHWGKTWVKSLPWDWQIVRHDLLLPGGEVFWRNDNYATNRKNWKAWYEILDKNEKVDYSVQVQACKFVHFAHTTQDGTIQYAKIRLTGDEREWRWKWFTWLPWPNIVKRVVDCHSDAELGERAGSWKGGMIGWGVEWKHDETMEEAFDRWSNTWDGS